MVVILAFFRESKARPLFASFGKLSIPSPTALETLKTSKQHNRSVAHVRAEDDHGRHVEEDPTEGPQGLQDVATQGHNVDARRMRAPHI